MSYVSGDIYRPRVPTPGIIFRMILTSDSRGLGGPVVQVLGGACPKKVAGLAVEIYIGGNVLVT